MERQMQKQRVWDRWGKFLRENKKVFMQDYVRLKMKDCWKTIQKKCKKQFKKEMKDMKKCQPFAINKIMKEFEEKIEEEGDNSMKVHFMEQFIKKKIIAEKVYSKQEKHLLKIDLEPNQVQYKAWKKEIQSILTNIEDVLQDYIDYQIEEIDEKQNHFSVFSESIFTSLDQNYVFPSTQVLGTTLFGQNFLFTSDLIQFIKKMVNINIDISSCSLNQLTLFLSEDLLNLRHLSIRIYNKDPQFALALYKLFQRTPFINQLTLFINQKCESYFKLHQLIHLNHLFMISQLNPDILYDSQFFSQLANFPNLKQFSFSLTQCKEIDQQKCDTFFDFIKNCPKITVLSLNFSDSNICSSFYFKFLQSIRSKKLFQLYLNISSTKVPYSSILCTILALSKSIYLQKLSIKAFNLFSPKQKQTLIHQWNINFKSNSFTIYLQEKQN